MRWEEKSRFWGSAWDISQSVCFRGKSNQVSLPYAWKVSQIHHNGQDIFQNLPVPFTATRYHSLIVERETLPECLQVTAETDDGLIMGLRHREYPVYGVQFHPESILTEGGKTILSNFLRIAGALN